MFGALRHGFRSLSPLKLVVNVVGEPRTSSEKISCCNMMTVYAATVAVSTLIPVTVFTYGGFPFYRFPFYRFPFLPFPNLPLPNFPFPFLPFPFLPFTGSRNFTFMQHTFLVVIVKNG